MIQVPRLLNFLEASLNCVLLCSASCSAWIVISDGQRSHFHQWVVVKCWQDDVELFAVSSGFGGKQAIELCVAMVGLQQLFCCHDGFGAKARNSEERRREREIRLLIKIFYRVLDYKNILFQHHKLESQHLVARVSNHLARQKFKDEWLKQMMRISNR